MLTMGTVLLIVGIAQWGCDRSDPAARRAADESREAMDALAAYGVQQKEEFVRVMREQGAGLRERMAALEARANLVAEDTQTAMRAALTELGRKADQLDRKIDQAGERTAAEWDGFRGETLEAWRDLEQAWEETRAKYWE